MSFNFYPVSSGQSNALTFSATSNSRYLDSRPRDGGLTMPSPAAQPAASSRTAGAIPTRDKVVEMVGGCEAELRLIQSRLGTGNELPNDAQTARELAHKARNLRFAVELWAQITARRSAVVRGVDFTSRPAA